MRSDDPYSCQCPSTEWLRDNGRKGGEAWARKRLKLIAKGKLRRGWEGTATGGIRETAAGPSE